jgi:alpha-glucosidase
VTPGDQDPPWWQGGVIYQIYVRSWYDRGRKGHGDLPGVIDKLDYLAWLGADGIWLSPTMPSPDEDWGYDVADYFGVQPGLGTLDDLDRLIAEAGTRGMAILLDLVPNHTSSLHPWFVDARSGRGARHRDWYVWADPATGGGPPNNWLASTGQSAWTFDAQSGQYYLHNFLPSQPDLNWYNREVRTAFEAIMRFWFDRGVAGLRIDVAHGLFHDDRLRDNPMGDPGPDARFGQREVYNKNRPEVHGLYRTWRTLAESYAPSKLLLGETFVLDVDRMVAFYGDNDELQLAFNFPFVFSDFSAPALRLVVSTTLGRLPPGACPAWTGSNHDVSRFATRWGAGDERKIRLALLALGTLPGTAVLYYGDEIGMEDGDIPDEGRLDRMTSNLPDRFRRDDARTPMPWSAAPGAGFTEPDVRPWLPFGDYQRRNVADQVQDPSSMLSLCRRLLALRHQHLGPGIATYEELPSSDRLWVYRTGDLVVAGNFSDETAAAAVPNGDVLLSTLGSQDARAAAGPNHQLQPWEGVILKVG